MNPGAIEAAIRPDDVHQPKTRLIAVENTHNRCHGSPLSPAYMKGLRELADRHQLKIHVDGARIFNSAAAQGLDVRELAADADSVSFCLSKALAAPVGSVVCGPAEFIARARRARKMLGGGMRQAGVLAAAGIVALDEMVDRLAEDHANARALAEALCRLDGLSVALDLVKTNIFFIEVDRPGITPGVLSEKLKARGILILPGRAEPAEGRDQLSRDSRGHWLYIRGVSKSVELICLWNVFGGWQCEHFSGLWFLPS